MRNLLILFILSVAFLDGSYAQCSRIAPFSGGPFGDYAISGNATLNFLLNGTKTLSFDSNFATTSGPDLHVYLSNETTVSTPGGVLTTPNTVEVGLLQSASGSQSYDLSAISPAIGLDTYTYVHIHCKAYDHYWGAGTFGVASGVDCATLSVDDDVTNVPFLIYPSVITNDEVSIQLVKDEEITIHFYSVLGELVQKPLLLNNEMNRIDVSKFQKGIYILRVTYRNQFKTQKIIVQ
ncbi:DM13 domain-containing protein [Flavicella marina]|uniref:DM13 domain-containing protein n=1 Tax=Flavicella marina TaxID=1475951 RepID=UPI001264CF6E|nr:DM13 domain-containing protein [Flavicella marina]